MEQSPEKDITRPTVTLLLPIFNEIDGLTKIFPQIDVSLFDDVFVIDGGSTDGSLEYLQAKGITNCRQQSKPGLQNAVMEAVELTTTDCMVEFSPDGNCKVEQLEALVKLLHEGCDMVVVSRYLGDAKSEDDTLVTAFGNWMFSKLFGFLGPYKPTDSLTIYRGFRKDAFDWDEAQKYLVGPVFEPMVSGLAALNKKKVIEIPGDEPARIGGETKMRIFRNGSAILLLFLRLLGARLVRAFKNL